MSDDEVYAPYDINKYQNPINQNTTDDSIQTIYRDKNPLRKKKKFNIYEDTNKEKENKDDKKSKLKPKLKTQNENFQKV